MNADRNLETLRAVLNAVAIRHLVELGADVNRIGTFGGPDHGQGMMALHLAAQSGQAAAVETPPAAGLP